MTTRIIHSPNCCHTAKEVSWYAATLIKPDELVFAGYTNGNLFTKDVMGKKIYNFLSYEKDYTINFNNSKINIIIKKLYYEQYRPDLTTTNAAEFFFDIILSGESNEIIDLFIKTAKKKYREDILDDTDDVNKINCWMFDDGYWESNYKSKKRNIDTVYLPKNTRDNLIDDIESFMSKDREKMYDRMGIPYKRNYLFEGLPGSGKTSLIRAIARQNLIWILDLLHYLVKQQIQLLIGE